jgi:pimeloyl-ACP methyl ester carboxylesterase
MLTRPDSTATCATIDVPTLIVVGDEDAITPPKEAKRLCESIRGARMEILQGAGHLSNIERPAAFNTVVSEFLASLMYN